MYGRTAVGACYVMCLSLDIQGWKMCGDTAVGACYAMCLSLDI
jgi:hypothetical protein